MFRRTVGLWLVMFMAFGPTASAATYYVSTSGSDTNAGTAPGNAAWRTITHALSLVTSGDIINVEAGTYANTGAPAEVFPLPLVDGVTLQGPPADPAHGLPATAILNGDGSTPIFSSVANVGPATTVANFQFFNYYPTSGFAADIFFFNATSVSQKPSIQNNEFQGSGPSTFRSAIHVVNDGATPGGSFDATISNNYIHDFYKGIFIDDSGYSGPLSSASPVISGNTINSNTYGIAISASEVNLAPGATANYSPMITGNTLSGNTHGIFMSLSVSSVDNAQIAVSPSISGNTIDNGQNAIELDVSLSEVFGGSAQGTFAPSISGNTIDSMTGDAIHIFGSASSVFSGAHAGLNPQIITNNTLTNVAGDGIYVNLSGYGSSSAGVLTMSPAVSGNSLSTIGGNGIVVPIWGSGIYNGTVNANPMITGNTVSGVTGNGIVVPMSLQADTTATVASNPTISSNTLSNIVGSTSSSSSSVQSAGLKPAPQGLSPAGAAILMPVSVYNAGSPVGMDFSPTISANTMTTVPYGVDLRMSIHGTSSASVTNVATVTSNHVFSPSSNGILFDGHAFTLGNYNANWQVSANDVHNGSGTGIGVFFDTFGGAIAGGAFNATIDGNTATNGGYQGIQVSLSESGGSSLPNAVTISNNSATNNADSGIAFRADGNIDLTNAAFQITQNQITGNGTVNPASGALGIFVGGFTTNPTLVSCNTITNNLNNGVVHGTTETANVPADFGGGNRGSIGKNRIFNNNPTGYDFFSGIPSAAGFVSAKGNYWGTQGGLNPTQPGYYAALDARIHDDEESLSLADVDATNFMSHAPTAACGNSAPVAIDDVGYTVAEDTTLTVPAVSGALVNDYDPDNDPIVAQAGITSNAGGTVVMNADGSFSYTPPSNFNGTDYINYAASDGSLQGFAKVFITVTAVNDPPVANNDTYSTTEDTQIVVNAASGVRANDTDVDNANSTLTTVLQTTVSHGTLVFNSDGSFTYTPAANYSGPDSFTYITKDPSNASSAPATATINVSPVNDPPNVVNDNYSVAEDASLVISAPGVLGNDTDVDGPSPLTVSSNTTPLHGSLVINSDGSFTYTPVADYNGPDSFTYTATDGPSSSTGTVNITVTPVNDPPVAANDGAVTAPGAPVTINVLTNDTDPDGDVLTISSFTQGAHGTVTCTTPNCTYTSASNFSGLDSFTYTISDGNGGTSTATVNINVIGNNADLSLTVSASPDPATGGEPVTYTAVVNNGGPGSASAVTISLALPDGSTFQSAEGGSCALEGRFLTCLMGDLANGDTATLLVHIIAPSAGTSITTEVDTHSSQSDPTPENNIVRFSMALSAARNTCPTTGATLLGPANNATDVGTSINFTWTPVTNATGYTVFGTVNGGPLQILGTTNAATTSLEVSLPASSQVTWFVRAQVSSECAAVDSNRAGFSVEEPDTCDRHGVATLTAPGVNATSASSRITYQWTAVRHADKYRVWSSINGAPFSASEETLATTLEDIVPFGNVEWYVESLFNGCASTESAHSHFTVPTVSPCNNSAVTLLQPANGTTVRNQAIDFSWSAAPNALGYEVWLSLNSGTPVLLGRTPAGITTFHHDVAPGSLEWFVVALYNGCPGQPSQHFTFTFDRPVGCPTAYPILTAPSEGVLDLTSPVTFTWSNVPGATQYQLRMKVNGGAESSVFTTQTHLTVPVATGAVEWSVEALASGCPSLISTKSRFTVVPPPPPCTIPDVTEMRAEANASSLVEYAVRWDPSAGAVKYELQEATRPDFVGATTSTVTGLEQTFKHGNDSQGTVAFYYYRVRGVNECGGGQVGRYSSSIAVGILPPRQADPFNPMGATPVENPQTTTYQLSICTTAAPTCTFLATAGQTFSARTDQPWLTVTPSSGVVPATAGPVALTLTVTATPTGLAVGANTGTIIVTFGATSPGRIGRNDGGTSGNANVSVSLVAPVANTPKNTPPPDALIIPAVAHSDGLNSHFESDIRVSNTSPQLMKYQLNFIPSGDTGITQGKQTTIDVEPGRTVALDDVLDTWFGAGANAQGAAGALEIRPLTSSSTGISSSAVSGLPNIVTFATSRTYSTLGAGSLGTFVPAIPFANFIGKGAAISLQQLSQTDSTRTNLGLLEGSGQPATVLIKMFSAAGQQIGSMTQNLTGGQHLQINSLLATKGITNVSDARVEISVTSATGKVTSYASVLDNKNNDAQLVSPLTLSTTGSAKYVLPGVADQATDTGALKSDVRLFNNSTSAVTATLVLHPEGSASPVSKDVTIPAGQVQTLNNIVQSLFGLTNVGNAALHITTAAPANLVATAKTYTETSTGTLGQFISAITPQQAITASSRPLQLLQVEESNRFSTDVGVAEVGGKAVDLEISIIPQDAKVAAKTTLSLGANEFRTMKQLLKSIGVEGAYNARVTVKVVGGSGAATAYASTKDLKTNDLTFVPAQ
jgi:parallel beta-helix repeat protein/VCBS repeat-containing protein